MSGFRGEFMSFKKLYVLPIAVLLIAGFASEASSKIVRPAPRPESLVAPGSTARRGNGPEVPFPLSASLPFPWSKIEGMWEGKINGRTTLFSFDVQVDYDGSQVLKVTQLDGAIGEVVANGLGLSSSDDNLVRSAMYGSYTRDSYMLFIGSYRNTKISKKPVTVLTLRPFGSLDGETDIQVVVKKLSNVPYQPQW
jgi:hypothetical protein